MRVVKLLTTLALRPLINGALQKMGFEADDGKAASVVADFLFGHFLDRSQSLQRALNRSNNQAWQALEMSLAGDSFWNRMKGWFDSSETRNLTAQMRGFLDAHALTGLDDKAPAFRDQCLRDLRAARRDGLLTLSGNPDWRELADQASQFARHADAFYLLDAEWRALDQSAALLQREGYPALAQIIAAPAAKGETLRKPSLLVLAVRFFFRRAVETDSELFQGLAFAQLEKLDEAQEAGFASLAETLEQHGAKLGELLEDVRTEVRATHGTVLDVQAEQQAQGQQLQEIYKAVQQLKSQWSLGASEVRPGDSLALHNEAERRVVKELLNRFRSLPAQQQKDLPALHNSLAQLEVATGDFAGAQQDFQQLASGLTEQTAKAEAHHNAYLAALERRAWTEGLIELESAIRLDPARFAPFPIDKFEPQRLLGAGGFGVAFLCKHRNSGSRLVIKTLRLDGLARDVNDVFSEARVLEELEHPGIIRVRDCDFADPQRRRPYLVMDYFDGPTLAEFVKENGPLAPVEALHVVRLMTEGLEAAHARGILHRDVKPANVLVRRADNDWRVKLIDFGLALTKSVVDATTSRPSGTSQTILGASIAGTLDYASPEQLGRLPGVSVGPRADLYGLARTCCFALFQTPQPTFQHWRSLPLKLAELLSACLEEQPTKRPQDCATLLRRFRRLEGDVAWKASTDSDKDWAKKIVTPSFNPEASASGALTPELVQAAAPAIPAVMVATPIESDVMSVMPAESAGKIVTDGQVYLAAALDAFVRLDERRAKTEAERALAAFNLGLNVEKGNRSGLLGRCRANLLLNKAAAALEDLQVLEHQRRLDPPACLLRGLYHEQRGEWDDALTALDAAIVPGRTDDQVHLARGRVYRSKGSWSRAQAEFEEAQRLRPRSVEPYIELGYNYLLQNKVERAIDAYSQAISCDPNHFRPYFHRGMQYGFLKQYDQALSDYAEAVRRSSDNARVLVDRGKVLQEMGRFPEAQADFNRAIELDKTNPWQFYYRGKLYKQLQVHSKALADFNEAIERDSQATQFYLERGETHGIMGNWSQAWSDLERAVRLKPDDANLLSLRGRILEDLNKKDLAIADYDRALRLNPKDLLAKLSLDRLRGVPAPPVAAIVEPIPTPRRGAAPPPLPPAAQVPRAEAPRVEAPRPPRPRRNREDDERDRLPPPRARGAGCLLFLVVLAFMGILLLWLRWDEVEAWMKVTFK